MILALSTAIVGWMLAAVGWGLVVRRWWTTRRWSRELLRELRARRQIELAVRPGACQDLRMQTLRLGAILVDHDGGVPLVVRQVGGARAHPTVAQALLEDDSIRAACEQDAEDNPTELDFGDVV